MNIKDYISIAREIRSDPNRQNDLEYALSGVVNEFLITDSSPELKKEFLEFIVEMGRELSDKHLVDLRRRDEFALILDVQAATTEQAAKVAEAVWIHNTTGLKTDETALARDIAEALEIKEPLTEDFINKCAESNKALLKSLDRSQEGRVPNESQTPFEAFIEAVGKFIQTITEGLKESKEAAENKWANLVRSTKGTGVER